MGAPWPNVVSRMAEDVGGGPAPCGNRFRKPGKRFASKEPFALPRKEFPPVGADWPVGYEEQDFSGEELG